MIVLSIRPIDIKMAIPKTQEMSKIEQENQNRIRFSLEHQLNEQNQQIEQNLKKVNTNEEASKTKVREDEEKDMDSQQNDRKDSENKNEADKNKDEKDKELRELLGIKEGMKDNTTGMKFDMKI